MKQLIIVLLMALMQAAIAGAQTNSAEKPQPLVFKNVTIIDVVNGKLKSGMFVLVAGNRIAGIGKKVIVPKDAKIIDASGKFLLPGLWDMHVHSLRAERVETFFPLFIVNGVTGIRDMGAPLKSLSLLKQWRAEIAAGARIGPRIFAAGSTLGGARPQNTFPAKNENEARHAVRTLRKEGADFIKVYSLLPRALFFAAADEAKKQGITFSGHVPGSVSVLEASDAGQKSMEHLYGMLEACSSDEAEIRKEVEQAGENTDTWAAWGNIVRTTDRLYGMQELEKTFNAEKCRAVYRRFVKNKTRQCPTLVMRRALAFRNDPAFTSDPRLKYFPMSESRGWNSPADTRNANLTAQEIADRKIRLRKESEMTGEMKRAGVELLAGTDLGNPYIYPGFSLHDELELLVEAGLSPLAALQAATINPSRFLGNEMELGTVEQGKLADLVLLDANPLESISNTKKINGVVVNGRFFDRGSLDKMLADAEAASSFSQTGWNFPEQ